MSESKSTALVPQVFQYNQQPVRTVQVDFEPWFVARDVCDRLGIVRVDRAVANLDADEKGAHSVSTPGGPQEMVILSEPGLYKLIARSRKPEARAFDRWVRHEVLPSIRKTGGYSLQQRTLEQDTALALYVQETQDQIAEIRRENGELRGLVLKLLKANQAALPRKRLHQAERKMIRLCARDRLPNRLCPLCYKRPVVGADASKLDGVEIIRWDEAAGWKLENMIIVCNHCSLRHRSSEKMKAADRPYFLAFQTTLKRYVRHRAKRKQLRLPLTY